MDKGDYNKIIKGAFNITQLSLTIITPMFLCIFGSLYLKNKYDMGNWIVLVGIFLGVSAGALNLFKVAKKSINEAYSQKGKYDPAKLIKYSEDEK